MQTLFQFHGAPGAAPAAVGGRPRGVDGGWRGEPEEERGASPLLDREGEERHHWRGAGAAGLRGVGGTRGRRSAWCKRKEREAARTAAWSSGAGGSGGAQALARTAGVGLARRALWELVAREEGGARGAGRAKRSGFRCGNRAMRRLFWGGRARNLADVSPWSIKLVVARGAGWSVLGEVKRHLAEKENG